MRRLFSKTHDTIRKARKGSRRPSQLKAYPPEILQEIFVHCCGDEYIDFFSHSSIEDEIVETCQDRGGSTSAKKREYQRPQWNTAYILKAVCKEWKAVVEGTPQLWQRIYLEFQPVPTIDPLPSVQLSESQVAIFTNRYTNALKRVIISRSGKIALHLKIATGPWPGGSSQEMADRLRMVFLNPLLCALTEECHRWSSLQFVYNPLNGVQLDELVRPLDAADGPYDVSLPSLRHLSLYALPDLRAMKISAPLLTKVTLSCPYTLEASADKITKLFTELQNVTTLVISSTYSNELNLDVATSNLAGILRALPNLTQLHWQGRFGRNTQAFPATLTRPIELEQLRSITMEDSNLDFLRFILRAISCPRLETLQILVGNPSFTLRSAEVVQAVSSIETVLKCAPAIKNVSVVQCRSLTWGQGTFDGKAIEPPKPYYVFCSGSQKHFQEALQGNKRWSKLPASTALDELPGEIMIVESSMKLRKYLPPGRIPILTVPTAPLSGWADRNLHCCSEERLTDMFDFIDFVTKVWPRGKTSIEKSKLSETWHNLNCLPRELAFLTQFMEMVRSKKLPSDRCCFTFAAVLGYDDSSSTLVGGFV